MGTRPAGSTMLRVTATPLPGLLVLEPAVFRDSRGFFLESYNLHTMAHVGLDATFVQDNHARSERGVLRGLHYQIPPHAHGKLVRVVNGEVFDVAVDLRRSSPTFGRWFGTTLSGNTAMMVWIPPGFAHGYFVLSEQADLLYKVTDFYHPAAERTLRWDDPAIGIEWPPTCVPHLSEKDRSAPTLDKAQVFD